MSRNALAVLVATVPLLACAPKPIAARVHPTVVVASSATASSVAVPVATAPAVDAAPSVSAPPSIGVAAVDAGPPEDPGPVVLTVQEWVLSSSTHLTITITAKGDALFDMTDGKKYRGKVTSEGLEAFRVALVNANFCGGKFASNVQRSIDIDSKLPAVRCSATVAEPRGVKSPRARAIRDALEDLKKNACHGPCPDLGGVY
jgi:hypothetical protein